MELTILGSGTLLSGEKRNPACYLLEQSSGFALLDCGPGCIRQLNVLGIDIMNINTIFISHFHLDHCADVLPLLMARYLRNPQANRGFKVAGPAGLVTWIKNISYLQNEWLFENRPEFIEIGRDGMMWDSVKVEVCRNLHPQPGNSYRFTDKHKFFYSADTGYYPPLINFAGNADTGLVECSLPDNEDKETHMTPSKAGKFAEQAKIKRLILTHLYPQNDLPDLADQVSAHYSGEVIAAADFMKFTLDEIQS